jgi:hypothetical protein
MPPEVFNVDYKNRKPKHGFRTSQKKKKNSGHRDQAHFMGDNFYIYH